MNRYSSLLSDLELKINEGHYRPGQKLPSVRDAAKRYGCSTGTVVRAYAELEKLHAIYSVPQSGYYVVDKPEDAAGSQDDGKIDFSSAFPDQHVFPYLDFQHCLNKAIDTYKQQLFAGGDPKGLTKLRHTLVSHLANDQVFARMELIMITSGAQRALEILAKMPFPNRKETILVEQPGYDIYLRYLEKEGLPVAGIARSTAGIDLRDLERIFKQGGIKFFYTMSRYHNPLGTTYSEEERKAIARLASKYDVYVVEDDYMGDLGEDRHFDPIYAYNRTSHVVYVKSFSKIIFPGLRIGAVVLPERLLEAFRAHRGHADTSLLSQAALDVYIKNGMYARHKRKISSQYAARIRAVHEAVRRYNGDGRVDLPAVDSGIYLPFMLPLNVNLDRLMKRLAARHVAVASGKPFYLASWLERDKFLRISVSLAKPDSIDEGVRTILEEVKREMRRP